MIEIIAAVVVLALLALLVPFILTKRKITAHLRDVYESHKYVLLLHAVRDSLTFVCVAHKYCMVLIFSSC